MLVNLRIDKMLSHEQNNSWERVCLLVHVYCCNNAQLKRKPGCLIWLLIPQLQHASTSALHPCMNVSTTRLAELHIELLQHGLMHLLPGCLFWLKPQDL